MLPFLPIMLSLSLVSTKSAVDGSRLDTGSSARRRVGRVSRVRQAATLCLSPLDSVDAHCRYLSFKPNLTSSFLALSSSSFGKPKKVEKKECLPKEPPKTFIREVAPSAN